MFSYLINDNNRLSLPTALPLRCLKLTRKAAECFSYWKFCSRSIKNLWNDEEKPVMISVCCSPFFRFTLFSVPSGVCYDSFESHFSFSENKLCSFDGRTQPPAWRLTCKGRPGGRLREVKVSARASPSCSILIAQSNRKSVCTVKSESVNK